MPIQDPANIYTLVRQQYRYTQGKIEDNFNGKNGFVASRLYYFSVTQEEYIIHFFFPFLLHYFACRSFFISLLKHYI